MIDSISAWKLSLAASVIFTERGRYHPVFSENAENTGDLIKANVYNIYKNTFDNLLTNIDHMSINALPARFTADEIKAYDWGLIKNNLYTIARSCNSVDSCACDKVCTCNKVCACNCNSNY